MMRLALLPLDQPQFIKNLNDPDPHAGCIINWYQIVINDNDDVNKQSPNIESLGWTPNKDVMKTEVPKLETSKERKRARESYKQTATVGCSNRKWSGRPRDDVVSPLPLVSNNPESSLLCYPLQAKWITSSSSASLPAMSDLHVVVVLHVIVTLWRSTAVNDVSSLHSS